MQWDRFQYICRKVSELIDQNIDVGLVINKARLDQAGELFGPLPKHNSLAGQLLDFLRRERDGYRLAEICNIYGKLEFAGHFAKSIRFNRVFIFLFYLLAFYLITSSIYTNQVMEDVYDPVLSQYLLPGSMWFYEHWLFTNLLVIFVLFMSGWFVYQLKQLLRFNFNSEASFFARLLVPKQVKQHYKQLEELLYYPLSRRNQHENLTTDYLNACLADYKDISDEMDILLKRRSHRLVKSCERLIQMSILVSTMLVFGLVFFFLYNAFIPLISN